MTDHQLRMNIPSNLEHVSEETRYDIGITCFLFKIHDKTEVRLVFGLVCCGCERHVNMFSSHPLVKVVFNLNAVLATLNKLNLDVMQENDLPPSVQKQS